MIFILGLALLALLAAAVCLAATLVTLGPAGSALAAEIEAMPELVDQVKEDLGMMLGMFCEDPIMPHDNKGKPRVIEMTIVALLARGHVLLEDVPGVGKTTLAHSLARSVDCSFKRIQFTSDLLPSDIVGVSIFNRQKQVFEFMPGPIFAHVVWHFL